MRRSKHPRAAWLIEHLADVTLFAAALPIALVALVLHWL